MFPGLHPTAMMSTSGMNVGFHGNANGPSRPPPGAGTDHNFQQQQHQYNGIGGPNASGMPAVGVKPAGPPFGLAHPGAVIGNPAMVSAASAAAQCMVS